MSIVVDPAQLAETLTQFGHAYLLTTDAAGVVKVNTVEPSVVGDAVVIGGPGMMQARLNVGVHAFATLIWPPVVHHGHTLIVDGTAARLVGLCCIVRPSMPTGRHGQTTAPASRTAARSD